MNRRRFFFLGMAGLAGAGFPPVPARARAAARRLPLTGLPLRPLGRTGLLMPRVSLGCAQVADPMLVHAALEAGIVHFDTAGHYGNGTNERLLGSALKGRPRDGFIVATKVLADGEDPNTGLFTERTTAAAFTAKFEKSLRRLGLDHVDILYLHQACRREAALFEPLMKALGEIKASGKARFIGLSTHQHEPEVIDSAAASGLYDVVLTSYNFRQPHAAEVRSAVSRAAAQGLGVVAMKVMAGVYWDAERRKPIHPAAALKWVLADPHVDTALMGCSTLRHIQSAVDVLKDPELTELERGELKLGSTNTGAGLYCSQCGACRPQCPAGMDIPTWMRGYMYARGYGRPARAKALIGGPDGAPACGDCVSCRVRCRMGYDVRSRVLDLDRLRGIPDAYLA